MSRPANKDTHTSGHLGVTWDRRQMAGADLHVGYRDGAIECWSIWTRPGGPASGDVRDNSLAECRRVAESANPASHPAAGTAHPAAGTAHPAAASHSAASAARPAERWTKPTSHAASAPSQDDDASAAMDRLRNVAQGTLGQGSVDCALSLQCNDQHRDGGSHSQGAALGALARRTWPRSSNLFGSPSLRRSAKHSSALHSRLRRFIP
jgi:hypothetical protein